MKYCTNRFISKIFALLLSLMLFCSFVGVNVHAEESTELEDTSQIVEETETLDEEITEDNQNIGESPQGEEIIEEIEDISQNDESQEIEAVEEAKETQTSEEELVEEDNAEVTNNELVEPTQIKQTPKTKKKASLTNSKESLSEIYISPSASGTEEGTKDNPVKSFDAAVALLESNPDVKTIYILNTTDICGTLTLPKDVVLKRAPGFSGVMLNVPAGQEATLEDIVIDGDKEQKGSKSIINVYGNLTMKKGSYVQNNNGSSNAYAFGAIHVYPSGNFLLEDGTIQNNTAAQGGGVISEGVFTMTGGLITKNRVEDTHVTYGSWGYIGNAGGGVYLYNGGVMNMHGGEVSYNYSLNAGGGIALLGIGTYSSGPAPVLNMTGGIIDHNVAESCGGGILVQSKDGYKIEANISGGIISNNEAKGGYNCSFAGGGIYVNGSDSNRAYLNLTNAMISKNVAYRSGGGIASCPTSHTYFYINEGALVNRNNTVAGLPDNDIYLTRTYGYTMKVPTAHIASKSLAGIENNWMHTDSLEKFENADKSFYLSGKYANVYLNSNVSEEDYALAESEAKVWIINNYSGTRGGGIGNNGQVNIGYKDTHSGKLSIKKIVDSPREEDYEKEFTFKVTIDQTIEDGTYGDLEFVDSTATFTLKHNEVKYVDGLPDKAKYTVEELDGEEFEVISKGEVGQFLDPQVTYAAEFTNRKEPPETPETPDEPTPEEPEKPKTPETPEKPPVPEKPKTPERPKTPTTPNTADTSTVQRDAFLFVISLMVAGCILKKKSYQR